MSGFDGYDQWKTASPYDDCDDEHCAYCGADLPDDVTGFSGEDESAVMEGFCNVKCEKLGSGGETSPRYGLPHFTELQYARRIKLFHKLYEFRRDNVLQYAKLDDILEFIPDGDFKWDDGDPGDANVYCCGEKDCPTQWHESYQNVTFERKDGKLVIEVHSGDSDGNWDIDCGWEEGEDFEASGVAYAMGSERLNDHFYGWAEYNLDAAETGKDPCSQSMMRSHLKQIPNWIDHCLDAAESHIGYLRLPDTRWQKISKTIRMFFNRTKFRIRRYFYVA